jgi:hypothetical protein
MWALFAGALIFAAGSTARAADGGGGSADECQVDKDCPGDTSCGGPVCDWYVDPTHHKCVPAGGKKQGMDGWCNGAASDCKCASEGATCVGVSCTFTLPKTTGGTGGSTGAGGASGTGGSGTGGTSAPAPASSDSGGGCTMASTSAPGLGSAGLLIGLGAIAFGIRRRRHAA